MGKIKQLVIMHIDLRKNETATVEEMHQQFLAATGGRVGLTDEQLREVGDE